MRCLLALAALLLLALPSPAAADVGYAREVAVVISISDYPAGWDDLPNAGRDGQRFAELMSGRGVRVFDLTDKEATRERILATLDEAGRAAAGGAEEPGLLIVYFAGHGETRGPDRNPQGYLVPYDGKPGNASQWLSMGHLRQKVAELDAVHHQLWILATCFSGSFCEKTRSGRLTLDAQSAEAVARRLQAGLGKPARRCITAGTADQFMADGPEHDRGTKFGDAVVQALTPRSDGRLGADMDGNGCVFVGELAEFVKAHGSAPGRNTPMSGLLEHHDQGSDIAWCSRRFEIPGPEPRVEGPLRGGGAEPAVARVESLYFVEGNATLGLYHLSVLRRVARALIEGERFERLRIEVHTDSHTADKEALLLGSQRAAAVQAYLIDAGVHPSRMSARNFGETRPIASNRTAKGRLQNRRLELILIERDVATTKVPSR